MSEEEGGAEDVSFLRTEDMVSLSCTGTGERVCLSAEGFGNRQCFLESIADKVTHISYKRFQSVAGLPNLYCIDSVH